MSNSLIEVDRVLNSLMEDDSKVSKQKEEDVRLKSAKEKRCCGLTLLKVLLQECK